MTIELTARYYVQDENSATLLLDGDLYREELQATPATALLDQLIKAVAAHYAATPHPLSEAFRLVWPVLKEAVADNDDHNSKEMLFYLNVAIEVCHLHHVPGIAPLFSQAEALFAATPAL